jgi:FixJ family two-component response regulator
MPECDGISLLKKIRMAGVSTPVIIMTGYGDVKTAVDSIKSGAVDFVEKPINADLLASCVKRAIEDYTEIKNESEKRNQALELLDSLTLRQVQILNLVCSGCSSKEIARELKISYRTVEVHRAAIMLRLRITSVAELVQIKLMADQASSHSSRLLSNK